ncbi:MAG: chloride channel protein [Angelakisella sp.]
MQPLENPEKKLSFTATPLLVFGRWVAISVLVGLVAGGAGVLFHFVLEWCTATRVANDWLLWLLPCAGLLIAWGYQAFGSGDHGTNMVLSAIRSDSSIGAATAPLIFLGTALTHLFGGSAGREGAALQLGGSIACQLGKLLRLDAKDSHIIVMCGTSAAFAALFGTPITAAVFSLEVVSVGLMYYAAIVPCTVAAVLGAMLAQAAGIRPTAFFISGIPPAAVLPVLQVALLGALGALVSILFCQGMRHTRRLFRKYLPNGYLRAAVGGGAVVLLTLLLGTRDYNGAGMEVVARAMAGTAVPAAFLLKILFTAITLGSGYKGGEVVPVLFTGSTFGCVAAPLLGLQPSFGAALGLVSVFCGVTNCPLTSILLSVELFGAQGLLYFGLAAAVAYMLSGYSGLYGEQKIVYSKYRAEFIDIKAK